MKIYTKTGDAGETSFFDRSRVSKADPRVDAYGEVDELNACLGAARGVCQDADLRDALAAIQQQLFAVGARLADPSAKIAERVTKAGVREADVERLEQLIDRLETELPPLRRFILPGGGEAGAWLHLARTVCRRAERRVVGLGRERRRADRGQVSQPAVRSAVRDGAGRESSAGRARDGVVNDLDEAYASCEQIARAHYENFPVASLLLPRPLRRHVAAVYAFARAADDFADEGSLAGARALRPAGRMAGAAAIRGSLAPAGVRAASGRAGGHRRRSSTRSARPSATSGCRWRLFEDLLSAFRQDVGVRRYATWDDVLDYSRRSANPVGRLVLRIAGYDDARLDSWSDAICTALQLTNFWQDVKPDFERGRVYLPQQQAAAYAADEADLSRPETSRPWRLALAAAVARTRALFEAGRPLCDALHGRLRLELRATWLGGMRILDRIERQDFDVLARRPGLGAVDRRLAGVARRHLGAAMTPRHQLLLLVPGAAAAQAPRHRRGVGLLPRGGRRGGRSGAGVAARLAAVRGGARAGGEVAGRLARRAEGGLRRHADHAAGQALQPFVHGSTCRGSSSRR